jgi:phosphatidyl-myo-inositol dimannoside synthase
MERLMLNVASGVAEYAQLTVIGPTGCSRHLPSQVTVLETSEKLVPFLLISTWLSIKACHKESFDVVIGGSGLVAPNLYLLSRLYNCKTTIFLHGLDLVFDSFLYQTIFIPCIRRASRVIANSRNTMPDNGDQSRRRFASNSGCQGIG